MEDRPFTLVVVSHVIHYAHQGQVFAYGPYAREIEVWADLFDRLLIASPVRHAPPPNDALALHHSNIEMRPQLETGGDTLTEKAGQLVTLPVHLWKLSRVFAQADAIHVRCPGNLGLLGVLLAPLFSRRIVAKYAGQWQGAEFIPPTFRLQRWLLASRWWRKGVVTVYGEWPLQPPQIRPFFTSMMTESQVISAGMAASRKTLESPLRVLYSGRLVPGKGMEVLMDAIQLAAQQGLDCELSVVGDGPERDSLERRAARLALGSRIRFLGALPFNEVMSAYDRCHVLALASQSEGWPKVIAEAMCHGVVCIGSDLGLLPWMLQGRGLTVPVDDPPALAAALATIAADPQNYQRWSQASAAWARQYSIEGLRAALGHMLAQSWQLPALEPASGEVSSR